MNTDRELLEDAAKAAGWVSWDWLAGDGTLNVYDVDGRHALFSPLTDDGDALRLAVKLDIEIYQGDDDGPSVYAGYWGKPERRDVTRMFCIELLEPDPYAATRRAIVRAAAAIGAAK